MLNRTIFETRQRSEELMQQALNIWKLSDSSESLEGLENDPVFRLLMQAVAYQANEVDNEIERLKNDVLEDFAELLTPYDIGHATPATVAVAMKPAPTVGEVVLDSDCMFSLTDNRYAFTPVIRTKVVNAEVKSVRRIDGRRWNVTLAFGGLVTNLSNMSFVVNNKGYRDLIVTADDKTLPLIRPWEVADMPMAGIFSLDEMMLSCNNGYDPVPSCIDLFARHNIRMYVVKEHDPKNFIQHETDGIDLVFEFTDVCTDFNFDASQLILNANILANAWQEDVLLDSSNPVARISGAENNTQLLHTLNPRSEMIDAAERVNVRRVLADRFNKGGLVRLLASLMGKLHTDFYAFKELNANTSDGTLYRLQELLAKLYKTVAMSKESNIAGTYAMLKWDKGTETYSHAVDVRYVLTNGTAVNEALKSATAFAVPEMPLSGVWYIGPYILATDEVSDKGNAAELVRYAIATNDRIVTPADMKRFCMYELHRRYGVMMDMVADFNVRHRLADPETRHHNACGYEIEVNIVLRSSNYIRRSFTDNIPQTELVLEKMMQVRSANIYPIKVNMRIE